MKVYAVYSIPRSPEYRLEKLFKTKEMAKEYIRNQKNYVSMIFLRLKKIMMNMLWPIKMNQDSLS